MSRLGQVLESEGLQRWAATFVAVWFAVLVLPPRVGSAVDHPTVWRWIVVVALVVGVVAFGYDAFSRWRRHLTGQEPERFFVAPEEVPVANVEAVIASTDDRLAAIRALREQHPGLGLKAAADLIDAARGGRD